MVWTTCERSISPCSSRTTRRPSRASSTPSKAPPRPRLRATLAVPPPRPCRPCPQSRRTRPNQCLPRLPRRQIGIRRWRGSPLPSSQRQSPLSLFSRLKVLHALSACSTPRPLRWAWPQYMYCRDLGSHSCALNWPGFNARGGAGWEEEFTLWGKL